MNGSPILVPSLGVLFLLLVCFGLLQGDGFCFILLFVTFNYFLEFSSFLIIDRNGEWMQMSGDVERNWQEERQGKL